MKSDYRACNWLTVMCSKQRLALLFSWLSLAVVGCIEAAEFDNPWVVDQDGDGLLGLYDCDDSDPTVQKCPIGLPCVQSEQCVGFGACEKGICTCGSRFVGEACNACANGWIGDGCDTCPSNYTGDACDRCANSWTGDACAVCPPNFGGDACDTCANGWTGSTCGTCPPNYQGSNCNECAGQWSGANCATCPPNYAGVGCDVCANAW
ncbi:MAG: hypothetical protein VX223_09120, partial [Myxococcota bacterium]|nr:hypothetical protein [Myxococcota bacterium]